MSAAPAALGPINEHSSARLTFTMRDQSGVAIPAADLNTLTLTLYDKTSGTILNGRNAQNVMNTNDVTVSELGLVTWELQPEDTAIINQSRTSLETHVALFTFEWDGGHHHYDQEMTVRNIARVP